jgi:hypothetical protein
MLAVRAHRCRRIASALVVALALSACTADEPQPVEPPTEEPDDPGNAAVGRDVAVILPPRGGADEAFLADLRDQLVDADELLGDRVDTVTTYVPASPAFIGDLARSFAERGIAVVCAIGPDAIEQLRPLVARFPAVEFCAIDGRPVGENDPDGLRRVILRTEELGHAVGVAARLEAGDDGIVGLVLGGDASGPSRFRSGLLAGLGDSEVVEADVPEGTQATPTDRLEAVLAAGATHVVVDGAPGMTAAVEAIDGRAGVLGPEEILAAAGLSADAAVPTLTPVVADWRFRWPRTLVGPVGALGDDGLRPRSLGLVSLATMRLGPTTSAATREQVRLVRAAFGRGQRDALEPVLDVEDRTGADREDEPAVDVEDEPDEEPAADDADDADDVTDDADTDPDADPDAAPDPGGSG